jgi:hypothetical protein
MEIKKLVFIPPPIEVRQKQEKIKQQKIEASKTFGDFLINVSNLCFEKCINVTQIYMSKSESKCLTKCYTKFTEAHDYSINKFASLNNIIENKTLNRSNEFGDRYE